MLFILEKRTVKVRRMDLEYREIKDFTEEQLQDLFLSVNWQSGKYPGKLAQGMKNSSHVISAWDKEKLVGLIRGLDDGVTVAFIHYLLVNPEYQDAHIGTELLGRLLEKFRNHLYVKIMPSDPGTVRFYEKFGFRQYDNYSAMVIKRL